MSDLRVSSLSFGPTTVFTPGTTQVVAAVVNSGNGTALPSLVRVEVSKDGNFNSGVTPIASMPVGALGPQQSVTLPIVANVPLLSDGVYFLRAICDASQRNDELSESNNITVASARLTLEQALPDLVVESPSILDANLEAGADATLRFNLRNIGTKALTVPVNYAVRISRDAIYSPKSDALVAGTKLNFSTTSPLNVNASTVVNVPFRVPTCIDQVVYTFFVEVDSGLAVVERNEGNNLGQVAKLMLRYEGLKPVLEFTEIDDGTRVSWTAARFGPGRHNKAKICVTSRPSVGDWSML
ncbi:MAG TPA: CARDB domain-containing protein, partial [Planctomycetota bacterium]|nr:CARDB domain-containing protein [Planctomycetota bacterium]